jgi:hypothetical protein
MVIPVLELEGIFTGEAETRQVGRKWLEKCCC